MVYGELGLDIYIYICVCVNKSLENTLLQIKNHKLLKLKKLKKRCKYEF